MSTNLNQSAVDAGSAMQAFLQTTVEEQKRIQNAVETAEKAKKQALKDNAFAAAVTNKAVSKLHKDLAQNLKDAKKVQIEAYKETLSQNGMDSKAYPLETAVVAVDEKFATPVLSTMGKGVRGIVGSAKYIANRVWNASAPK